MGLVFESWWGDIALLLFGVLLYVCHKLNDAINYFEKLGFPSLPCVKCILLSKELLFLRISFVDYMHEIYRSMEGHPIIGFFQITQPILMVRDPELAQRILVKDFAYFHDHGITPDLKNNPLEGHLFNMTGAEWRTLRHKLTPIFSSGKLKWMFSQLCVSADSLVVELEKVAGPDEDVPIRDLSSRYSIDVISSCAFGLDAGALKNPDCDFKKMAIKIFNTSKLQTLKFLFARFVPRLVKFFRIKTFSPEINDFFFSITKQAFEQRTKSGEIRNDFIQLLLELRKEGSVAFDPRDEIELNGHSDVPEEIGKLVLTDELLTAQSFIFLVAGWENATSVISFAFYHIGKDADVQKKAREEIRQAKKRYENDINYEALRDMHYLEHIVSETFRLHSPGSALLRYCNQTYPLEDGRCIRKGTTLVIPTQCFQTDPQYYCEPTEFRPDRFDTAAHKTTPSYLPFGNGPRICIAQRFALLEIKLVLAKVVDSFEVTVSPKVIEPIKLVTTRLQQDIEGGMWLRFTKI